MPGALDRVAATGAIEVARDGSRSSTRSAPEPRSTASRTARRSRPSPTSSSTGTPSSAPPGNTGHASAPRSRGARAHPRPHQGFLSLGFGRVRTLAWCSRRRSGAASPGGTLMAVVTPTSALDAIREKVEANERLSFDDGLVLMESDDLLQLGELADTARAVRGGTDDVYFVQNLYVNQTNVCRVKCKFCAFAVTQKQPDAYTHSPDELVEDALRQRELSGFTEIHMVDGESPHVDFDYYVEIDPPAPRGDARRPPQVLHGERDPPHDDALGPHPRAGAGRAQGGRARVAPGRRRRGLRRSRAPARRAREGAPGLLVPHAPHRARPRDPDALHDALRPRRDLRGAGRPPSPPPRPPGRDRRLPRLRPARVPSREHRLRAPRLDAHRRLRRPQDDRGLAAPPRQRRRTSRPTGS